MTERPSISLAGATSVLPPFGDRLPRPVYPRSVELCAGAFFAVHAHRWNQLTYATSGSLIVGLEDTRYVITPQQAIWLPTGTVHTSGSRCGATLRSVYIADTAVAGLPDRCVVMDVPAFLRSLIVELDASIDGDVDDDYVGHISALIIGQLRRGRFHDFSLPWPRDEKLGRLCSAWYDRPADSGDVAQAARDLALGTRTLARRFKKELGMTIRDWRRRLRVFRALEWLADGRTVTQVAMDLGYASPSAFTYMFHQQIGCSPTEWRAGR